MSDTNKITQTCLFVAENSSHVKINRAELEKFAKTFDQDSIKHWIDEMPCEFESFEMKEKLHFLLIFNSLSFSYWGDPKWSINYKIAVQDGASAMVCAISKALKSGIPFTTASFLRDLDAHTLETILSGNIQIPLFQERLNILNEVGSVLEEKFGGELINLIMLAKNNSMELLQLIVDNFPNFNDFTLYKKKNVYFYKRAQLLVADIFQSFPNQEFTPYLDIDRLTACADYKLPWILRRLNILSYSKELEERIDNKIEIPKNSEYEVEIRANTIHAIELIKDIVKLRIKDINSIYINDRIWIMSQNKTSSDKPYHLTRTTCY